MAGYKEKILIFLDQDPVAKAAITREIANLHAIAKDICLWDESLSEGNIRGVRNALDIIATELRETDTEQPKIEIIKHGLHRGMLDYVIRTPPKNDWLAMQKELLTFAPPIHHAYGSHTISLTFAKTLLQQVEGLMSFSDGDGITRLIRKPREVCMFEFFFGPGRQDDKGVYAKLLSELAKHVSVIQAWSNADYFMVTVDDDPSIIDLTKAAVSRISEPAY